MPTYEQAQEGRVAWKHLSTTGNWYNDGGTVYYYLVKVTKSQENYFVNALHISI